MSAIGGFCNWDERPVSEDCLAALAAAHHGGGPDGGGTAQPYSWLALQAHVLHFDLLSSHERQPYVFGHGSVLTWDGRLDNREDLLLMLQRQLGADMSDAALVASAYERWGLDALTRLIGDWSLALWDAPHRRMVLARDYMGNRPLHYRATSNRLAWATRLEALAASENLRTPDDVYIAGYLTTGVPIDRTPLKGALSLLAGQVLVGTRDGTAVRTYWKYTPSTLRYRRTDTYSEHLRHLFTEAVKVRLRAKRQVWAHLSGGWDTSTIVCLAHRLIELRRVEAPGIQPISTIFEDPEAADERPYMAAVERWCNLQTVPCSYPELPTFAEMLGQALPLPLRHWYNMREPVQVAGDHVVLTGCFGDLFSGKGGGWLLPLLEPLHDGTLFLRLQHMMSTIRTRRISVMTLLARSVKHRYDWFRSPWRSVLPKGERFYVPMKPITGSVTPALLSRAQGHAPVHNPSTAEFPTTKQYLVDTLYGIAAVGVLDSGDPTLRVWHTHPFVHRPLIEFLVAIPHLALSESSARRAAMRRALTDILPPEILAQTRKRGVVPAVFERSRRRHGEVLKPLPLLTEPLSQWQLVQREIVEPKALTEAIQFLRRGELPSEFLDRCLRLEAWLRTLASLPSWTSIDAERPTTRRDADFVHASSGETSHHPLLARQSSKIAHSGSRES